MKFKDFEVGGISLNGCRNVIVDNCLIGPSFKNVGFRGTLSLS